MEGACENKEPSVTIALQSKPQGGGAEILQKIFRFRAVQRTLENFCTTGSVVEKRKLENIVFKLMRKGVTVAREWEKAPGNHYAFRFSKWGTKTLSSQDNKTSRTIYIYIYIYKGKVIPLHARCGPEGG